MCQDESTLYYLTNRVRELESEVFVLQQQIAKYEQEKSDGESAKAEPPAPDQSNLYKKGLKWGR